MSGVERVGRGPGSYGRGALWLGRYPVLRRDELCSCQDTDIEPRGLGGEGGV